jgi:hypothetical protein
MLSGNRLRAGLFFAATLAAFTPIASPLGSGSLSAGAECTTCCSQPGPKCVVCSAKCVVVEDAYDNGTGACPINDH